MTREELVQWRGAHDLTRGEAARLLGVTVNYCGHLERGERPIRESVLDRIATATIPPVLTGAQLRAWRVGRGLLVKHVARGIGCGATYYTLQETGRRRVTLATRTYVAAQPWATSRYTAPLTDAEMNRQHVLACIAETAGTSAAIQARLPFPLHLRTIERHLVRLEQDGLAVRWQAPRHGWLWRRTLQRRTA